MRPLPYLLLMLVTALASIGYQMLPESDPRILPAGQVDASLDYSNIMPADYVGPDACIECHPTQHQLWQQHPHSKMNQLPSVATVKSDFDDAELALPTGTASFTTEDGEFFMTIRRDDKVFRRYIVTRTVGSRFMQYFIGKQIAGPEAADDDIYGEHMLPFAYWFELQRWFPRQYFDKDGDESLSEDGIPLVEAVNGDPGVRPYTKVCMNCHNTFPYAFRVFHKRLVGFRQANVSLALDEMCSALKPDYSTEASIEAFRQINWHFDPDQDLVSIGISCESCHFGGREHVQNQRKMRFLPTNPMLKITPDDSSTVHSSDDRSPAVINGICAQCHSGPGIAFVDGGQKSNSSEALDLQSGFCASQMTCIDCHDPHTASPFPTRGGSNPKHVAACVRCHDQYADPAAAVAHSRHDASHGVSCLDCHMPRYHGGLNGLARTHRVSMPVNEKMMAASSANACNVCHIDRSLRWTLDELRKGWNKDIRANTEWTDYHNLNAPASVAWSNSRDNHMRYVAAQCIAEKGMRDDAPTRLGLTQLVERLNDPEAATRVYTENAIRDYLDIGAELDFPVNVVEKPAVRRRQIDHWLKHIEESDDFRQIP